MVVVIVAACLRLWLLLGLPLVLTNDSLGYVTWGREFLEGKSTTISPMRTPGYPLFLAAVFRVFGIGPHGVHIAQSLLGIATAAVAAWTVRQSHGNRWALAVGLFFALWPTIVCWESYLLTESLAIFLVVLAVGLAITLRGGAVNGGVLGVLLGVACLVRPSVMVLAAALGLGWWLRARERRAASAITLLVGLAVTTGPWVAFNVSRGVYGLAGAERIAFWYGMESAGALDDSYALSPRVSEARDRLRSAPRSEAAAFKFLEETNAWGDRNVEAELGRWTRASIRSRPGAYVRGVARVFLSHLGIRSNDVSWFVWRLSVDGREHGQSAWNMQVSDTSAAREFGWRAGQAPPLAWRDGRQNVDSVVARMLS